MNRLHGKLSIVVAGLAAGTILLVAGTALAGPSMQTTDTSSGTLALQANEHDLACVHPLILGSGGLCCPGLPTATSPCVATSYNPGTASVEALPTLYVRGVRIPLPITLQIVKNALDQPFTHDPKDYANLACRRMTKAGSHFKMLHCSLVGHPDDIKPGDRPKECFHNCILTRMDLNIAVMRYVNASQHRATVLANLLSKAPGASATYTLRAKEQVPLRKRGEQGEATTASSQAMFYPLYVTFVVEQGKLVNVQMEMREGEPTEVRNLARVKAQRNAPPTTYDNTGDIQALCAMSNLHCK